MTSSFQPGEGPSRPFSSLREPSFEALVGSAGPAINLNSVTTAGRAAQHTLSPVGRLLRGEIIIATDGDNITSCSNNTTATRESDRANNVGPRAKWKETSGSDQYKCLSTFQYESELWSLLACCYPPPNGHPPLHPSPLEFINFDIKTIGSRYCDFPTETTWILYVFLYRSITDCCLHWLHWWRRKLWHTRKFSMLNVKFEQLSSPVEHRTVMWCSPRRQLGVPRSAVSWLVGKNQFSSRNFNRPF